jgi:hypothetical protein
LKIFQNGDTIQDGGFLTSETYIFLIALKTSIFNRFQKLECIRNVFLLTTFYRKNVFSKIQNGGFFEDDVIFEKKSTIFQTGRSHPKLNIFQIQIKEICSTTTQDIPKKIAKENFPRWWIFSKCRLYFFLV